MRSFFHSVSQFDSQKSLRQNFDALCSLSFNKTRSHATQELVRNLSDKKLNFSFPVINPEKLSSPTLTSLLARKNALAPQNDFIDLDNYDEIAESRIRRQEISLDAAIQAEQQVLFRARVQQSLPAIANNTNFESMEKKLLHDLAILTVTEKALLEWQLERQHTSKRVSLVNNFQKYIKSVKQQYEMIYDDVHAQHLNSLVEKKEILSQALIIDAPKPKGRIQKLGGETTAGFFNEPKSDPIRLHRQAMQSPAGRLRKLKETKKLSENNYQDYFNTHDTSTKPAVLLSVLSPEEKQKYAHILNGTRAPQPKQHWWNRLGFAVFTPFLNLLIDTDSFNFFVDGFNVFSDLVRAF